MKTKLASLVSSLLEQSIDFRVNVSPQDLYEILSTFRVYNDIPRNIADIAKDLQKEIGPISFGGQNSNNGSFHNLRIRIGNEDSLVLYVESNLFYRKGDCAARHEAVLKTIGKKYKANEIDVETVPLDPLQSQMVKARFWWD